MARSANVIAEYNFKNGLVTEASALNFPESACTDMWDCEIANDGSVQRRLGFEFEEGYETKVIPRGNVVVERFLWKNVSGDGNLSLLVMQVGATLYFYNTSSVSLSAGAIIDTLTLTPVSGAPSVDTVEAQFSSGNGYLFVTHPYCDPLRVSFDSDTQTVSETVIDIKIRDFEGDTADPLSVTGRPTSTLGGLNINHHYNLLNQGWESTQLTAWDTAQTTMPSNADVVWRFKDGAGDFSASTSSINRVYQGNTPAPKGRYILSLVDQDRETASGLSGVTNTDTGYQRVSTSAFFAGRVFWAGLNDPKTNSSIYFTQIVERDEQYAFAYQVNDPTAEDLFDLLPSDGGVIRILEAGTIFKLMSVPGGLVVFAANGIWFVTGSQGIGFTATDYSVQKLSSIQTNSTSSFIDVAGMPMWWNAEGIYTIIAEGNLPKVQNISENKIKRFFDAIPFECKKVAKGAFHVLEGVAYWTYRSEGFSSFEEAYEFDRVLLLDVRSGAFYPWTISESDVKIHGVFVVDSVSGQISTDQVVNGADTVVDSLGNNVVVYSAEGGARAPDVRFIVSLPSGSDTVFTFAQTSNNSYVDWETYEGTGLDYTSYFINGYKIQGQAMRKQQATWTTIYSKTDETPVSYYFTGLWDFANTGDGTGRWSVEQLVAHNEPKYATVGKRLKVRGNGKALQFKVKSVPGKAFDILGWSSMQTVNQLP